MNTFGKIMIGLAVTFILVACSDNDDVHNEISTHLEATVEIERTFEEHQENIFALEKEDEEIYTEIISLGTNDYEKVVSLTEQAIELLEEREEEIKLEKASLIASREEFEQIEPLLADITDSDDKRQTEKLYETMMNRYKAYDEVYESYLASIQLTKELYAIFQEEVFSENDVYSLITNVNESYDQVIEANEQFNKETVLYNQLKQAYYEMIEENK